MKLNTKMIHVQYIILDCSDILYIHVQNIRCNGVGKRSKTNVWVMIGSWRSMILSRI